MSSPRRVLELELRTNRETVDKPAERLKAERKVFSDPFGKGDVRVIIANVDPITNIYHDSG